MRKIKRKKKVNNNIHIIEFYASMYKQTQDFQERVVRLNNNIYESRPNKNEQIELYDRFVFDVNIFLSNLIHEIESCHKRINRL